MNLNRNPREQNMPDYARSTLQWMNTSLKPTVSSKTTQKLTYSNLRPAFRNDYYEKLLSLRKPSISKKD